MAKTTRRRGQSRAVEILPAVIEDRPAPLPALLGELTVRVRPSVFREEVTGDELSLGLTLAEIVEQLGPPDAVAARHASTRKPRSLLQIQAGVHLAPQSGQGHPISASGDPLDNSQQL